MNYLGLIKRVQCLWVNRNNDDEVNLDSKIFFYLVFIGLLQGAICASGRKNASARRPHQ